MKSVSYFASSEAENFAGCTDAFLPHSVLVPLEQDVYTKASFSVAKGDLVREGQPISVPANSDGAAVHSPVPGLVRDIREVQLHGGRSSLAAEIRLRGEFSFLGRESKAADWKLYSPDSLRRVLAEAGVVNTFRYCASLASHIARAARGGLLAVRMFDDDPSRVAESLVARVFRAEVAQGSAVIARAMSARGIAFAVPQDFDCEAFWPIVREFCAEFKAMIVRCNNRRYPSGLKENIVEAVRRQEKGPDEGAFESLCEDDLFVDPQTALNAYRAAAFGIPQIENFVHVSGDCARASGVFRARMGMTLRELSAQCGGFMREPSRVVVNGMILGSGAPGLDVPISKSVKSVAFLSGSDSADTRAMSCTLCGDCRVICPAGLAPDVLYRYATGGRRELPSSPMAAIPCSGCGLCNSVCQARLPLCQAILNLKENGGANASFRR